MINFLKCRNIKAVRGLKIAFMDELKTQFPEMVNDSGMLDWKFFEEEIRPGHPIQARRLPSDQESISFTIGPGACDALHIIEVAKLLVELYDQINPATKYKEALQGLRKAIDRLENNQKRRK